MLTLRRVKHLAYLVLQHGLCRNERLAHDVSDLRPQRIKVVPPLPHPLRKCGDGPLAARAALLRIPVGRAQADTPNVWHGCTTSLRAVK